MRKKVNSLINVLKKCHKYRSLSEIEITVSVLYEDIRDASSVNDIDPIALAFKRLLVWGYEMNQKQIEYKNDLLI